MMFGGDFDAAVALGRSWQRAVDVADAKMPDVDWTDSLEKQALVEDYFKSLGRMVFNGIRENRRQRLAEEAKVHHSSNALLEER